MQGGGWDVCPEPWAPSRPPTRSDLPRVPTPTLRRVLTHGRERRRPLAMHHRLTPPPWHLDCHVVDLVGVPWEFLEMFRRPLIGPPRGHGSRWARGRGGDGGPPGRSRLREKRGTRWGPPGIPRHPHLDRKLVDDTA